jgi:hypothetical protein
MASSRKARWLVKVLAQRDRDVVDKTLALTDEQYRGFCRFPERFSDGDAPAVKAPAATDQPTKAIPKGAETSNPLQGPFPLTGSPSCSGHSCAWSPGNPPPPLTSRNTENRYPLSCADFNGQNRGRAARSICYPRRRGHYLWSTNSSAPRAGT